MGSTAVLHFANRKGSRVLPAPGSRRRGLLLLSAVPLLGLLVGGSWLVLSKHSHPPTNVLTHQVQYETLDLTVSTHGTLQSAETHDIVCQVKARALGSTLATTIKWIVDDGSRVHRGDRLVEFDSSGIEEDLRAERIALLKAKSDWEQSEENYKIVASQNKADLEAATITLTLADLDLEKYLKGDYEQAHEDVASRLSQAEANQEMSQDRVAWSARMLKKGFVSQSQAQMDRSRRQSADVVLDNVRQEMRVLEQYTRKAMLFDLRSKAADARRALECVKSQSLCKELQARIDRLTKRSIYEKEQSAVHDLKEKIQRCTICSLYDGTVIYVSQQGRYGRGSQQSIIAQGEPVREGQALMQITDVDRISAEILIPESYLAHLRSGNEVLLQPHAFPDQILHGHIKRVSNFVSQYEWWLTDTHVYPAEVVLDQTLPGLKAGMTADIAVLLDRPLQHVLAVPVEALTAPVKSGETNFCFVHTPHGAERREVTIGLSSDTMVEIRDGLKEGEAVILNP
jgi:HlyD family secretion protein